MILIDTLRVADVSERPERWIPEPQLDYHGVVRRCSRLEPALSQLHSSSRPDKDSEDDGIAFHDDLPFIR